MSEEMPSRTQIREKILDCHNCGAKLRLDVIENTSLGISEPKPELMKLTEVIQDQYNEYQQIHDAFISEHKRNEVLWTRFNTIKKILHDYAMTTTNKSLLDLLEKLDKGEI